MKPTASVAELCASQELSVAQLAERSGLEAKRIQAIVEGRWTPSPGERQRIAAVFDRVPAEVAWGHKNPVAHVQGHGPQFGRSP